MKQLHYICLSWLLLRIVQVDAFQAWMNISGNRILGDESYISCSYRSAPGEVVASVYIWPSVFTNSSEFYFMIAPPGGIYSGSSYHDRLSVTVSNTTGMAETATMKIANVQCSDEHVYGCSFHYRTPGETTIKSYIISQQLIVRGPPSPPVVTLETQRNQVLENDMELSEISTVVARCKANVGRSGLGSIRWRVFRKDDIENITQNDNRIHTVAIETIDCTVQVEQKLILQVSKDDRNLLIVCFVHNSDFPIEDSTMQCSNTSSQFCGQTQQFSVATEDDSHLKTIIIGCINVAAGFVSAVLLGTIYHCLVKTPPQQTPQKKQQPQTKEKGEEGQPQKSVVDESEIVKVEQTSVISNEGTYIR